MNKAIGAMSNQITSAFKELRTSSNLEVVGFRYWQSDLQLMFHKEITQTDNLIWFIQERN